MAVGPFVTACLWLQAAASPVAHVEEWGGSPRCGAQQQSLQRGIGGEELVSELAEALRDRGTGDCFSDPDFPPENTSLYRDRRVPRPSGALGPVFLKQSESRGEASAAANKPVVWCRAAQIGLKAELQYSQSGRDKGKDAAGAAQIWSLVDDGTIVDETLVFFPYKTAEGARHEGWESGQRRRWADCRHEFAGFEATTSRQQKGASSGLKVWHHGAVHPTDIQQGMLGDCYLMAACASIALLPPEYLVHDLILDCSDVGLFGVKFYIAGRWVSVAIDDQFPCILSGGVLRPCFAQPSSDGAVWTMVIEKAFAKLMGSFEALIGGQCNDALNYLCGGDVQTLELSGAGAVLPFRSVSAVDDDDDGKKRQKRGSTDDEDDEEAEPAEERIWHELCRRVPLPRDRQDGGGLSPTTAASSAFFSCAVAPGRGKAAVKAGLNTEHQYSVLGAIDLSNGERLIEVRDPHGRCEWAGAYCSADRQRWTGSLKREVLGSSRAAIEDGSAFLKWSDFMALFSEIGVCEPFPVSGGSRSSRGESGIVRRESVLGRWEPGASAGGPHGFATFPFNPAFSLKVPREQQSSSRRRGAVEEPAVQVKLTLSQPDTRPMPRDQTASSGGGVTPSWVDMSLYCLTEEVYLRLCAPRDGGGSRRSTTAKSLSRLWSSSERHDGFVPDWVREIKPVLRLTRRLSVADVDLIPGVRYVLVACAWNAGVCEEAGRGFGLVDDGVWDFCVTAHAADGGASNLKLAALDSRKLGGGMEANREQRKMMDAVRTREAMCCVCAKEFEAGASYYSVPEGQCHTGRCHDGYRERTARKCMECGEAVLERYHALKDEAGEDEEEEENDWAQPKVVHSGRCYDQHREKVAPRCAVCHGAILSKYYSVPGEDDMKVHAEGANSCTCCSINVTLLMFYLSFAHLCLVFWSR